MTDEINQQLLAFLHGPLSTHLRRLSAALPRAGALDLTLVGELRDIVVDLTATMSAAVNAACGGVPAPDRPWVSLAPMPPSYESNDLEEPS